MGFYGLAFSALGQEASLDRFQVVTDPPRPDAPWAIQVGLSASGNRPISGVLKVLVKNRVGQTRLDFQTDEIVLLEGHALKRLIWLPPWVSAQEDGEEVMFSLSWVDVSGSERLLNMSELRSVKGVDDYHTFTLIDRGSRRVAGEANLIEEARLDRALGMRRRNMRFFNESHTVMLSPGEFPTSPVNYCAFDMVLLMGEAFSKLSEDQLSALDRWVAAGGHLLVSPFGVPVEVYQLEFLKKLAQGDPQASYLSIDRETSVLNPYRRVGSMHGHGLGRVVIVGQLPSWEDRSDPLHQYNLSLWRRAFDHLWRVPLKPNGVGEDFTQIQAPDDRWIRKRFEDELGSLKSEPFPLVWPMLCALAFLAVIGPVDYAVFRRLDRRKLTWIFFPLITVAYAQYNMGLANRHHDGTGQQKTIHVVDLDQRGHVVRRSSFRLAVPSVERLNTEVERHAIVSALRLGRNRSNAGGELEPKQVRGVFPGRYEQVENERRWTPKIVREFHIPIEDTLPVHAGLAEIPWADYLENRSPTARRMLQTRLEIEVGPCRMLREDQALTEVGDRTRVGYRVFHPRVLAPRGGARLEDMVVEGTGSESRPSTIAFEIDEGDEVFLYRRTD